MVKKPTYEEMEKRVEELERTDHVRMQVGEELKRGQQRLHDILKGMPLPTVVFQSIGQDFLVVYYSETAEVYIKNHFEKYLDKSARSIYKNRPDILEDLNRCFEEKTTFIRETSHHMFTTDEEKYLTLSFAYVPPDMVLLQYEDITDRTGVEDALRDSEQLYKQLVENARDIIYTVSLDATIKSMNPAFENMTGWAPSEFIGKHLTSLVHPDDWPLALEMGQLALQGEKPPIHEIRVLSKSGEYITGEFSITPFIQNEKVVGILGVGRDITDLRRAEEALQKAHDDLEKRVEERTSELSKTNALLKQEVAERKHVEEALRESEEKYRFVVDNANEAIFIAQDEVIKFPNPKTEELVGYSAEELAKVPFANFIHPEDRDMVLDMHQRRLAGEEIPATYSFRIINRDGEELWVQLNTVLIKWSAKPATLNFIREITKQKKLEAQLQQAIKMEAIGTLAGGMAHDFNNLLMSVQGNASLMLLDTDSGHPHYERLKNIEQSVRSGAALTKQLLGISKGGKYEVKPTYLNELIKSSLNMFGRTKKEITTHAKYQKDIWPVDLDQSQIEQVLLNLYVNAWQAMPGEGEIYLQTENVTLDEKFVRPYNIGPGKYVKISVTDTGVGMDERTMERIFDPFFTTKEIGRGTGLGLASVYGIIKSHGGIIKVDSKRGEGTTFTIYLPASEKEPKSEKDLPKKVLKGTETILLVDDEDMIINVGQEILIKLGYKVLIARSGKEALEVYKENQDKIDMIILDIIMPDMGGVETYDRMKEINPDITVLLSSGYSINAQVFDILKKGCNGFIQKPFDIKELSQKLREILKQEVK